MVLRANKESSIINSLHFPFKPYEITITIKETLASCSDAQSCLKLCCSNMSEGLFCHDAKFTWLSGM